MIFEIVLFGFALYKSARSLTIRMPLQDRPSLTAILLEDNILYFFGISTLLILLNIMSVGTTLLPWFSFGPFHAGVGIMTTHMLMHLRKAAVDAELTEFYKSSCDQNPEGIDIDEIIRYMDEGIPKFIISTSTRSSFSSSASSIEVDVEQFAGSSESQASGSSSRKKIPIV
ncbi:hypothetical protein H1R20_g306, partial [Candolleomyces eurysporus]